VGNGADWEWFVELPGCMVGFRVQAKRLYSSPMKNGAYGGFKTGGHQIDDLIKSAGQLNPVYVFYNHRHVKNEDLFKRSSKTNWFGGSAWGCSVATARFMKSIKRNSLAEVFPGMVPWHRFFVVGNSSYRGCSVERMMAGMDGGQKFKLADAKPDWVSLILEEPSTKGIGPDLVDEIEGFPSDVSPDGDGSEPSPLDEMLKERNLRGVAYFDFTEFRED